MRRDSQAAIDSVLGFTSAYSQALLFDKKKPHTGIVSRKEAVR